MRLNIVVEDDLMTRFKVECAKRRTTQADIIRGLIEEWTKEQEEHAGEPSNT